MGYSCVILMGKDQPMVTLVVVISALVNKSYGQNKKKTKTKNTYKNRSGGWWHFVGTLNENCRFCRDNLRGKLVSMLSAKKKMDMICFTRTMVLGHSSNSPSSELSEPGITCFMAFCF